MYDIRPCSSVKRELITFAAAFLLALLCGCISTPITPQRPASMPVLKVDDSVAAGRKTQFINAVQKSKVRGVAVYTDSWKDFSADHVVNLAKSYSFNRIYFVITSEAELDGRFEELLDSAKKADISSWIVIRQRDYFNRYRGNAFVRCFLKKYPDAVEVGKTAAEYVRDGKAAGFVILLEPHRFSSVEQRRGGIDGCFLWSDFHFGIGHDNDMLMKRSFAAAAEAKKMQGNFVPAIADFYHEWAVEGKLSCGKINEVARLADGKAEVLLFSTGNKPSEMASGIKNEFAAADCSIIPVFMVADHLSESSSRLRRRNFSDFVRGINYGVSKLSDQKAFGGFVTGPLRALEYMCHEKE